MDSDIEKRTALRKKAREAAKSRGHNMVGWFVIDGHRSYMRCSDCNMRVDTNTRPLPNEIDIGGEAIALDCSKGNNYGKNHV